LIEWHGAEPPAEIVMSERIRAFLARPAQRARIVEIDGALCTTLIAANFDPADPEPLLERIDVILQHKHVVLRRRRITGACAALSHERIADAWGQTPPGQRDTSVLFLQIIDAVVDSSTEVLDEIRRRVGLLEERMLASNPALNPVLTGLLELSHHLGRVRDGLLPLRGEIREIAELRDPVERQIISPAAERWLRSVEMDLAQDVPAALSVAESRIGGALLQLQGERSEATNRVVLLLTIITVAFFIPTLITGLYGMNVPLPEQRHGLVFWLVVALAGGFLVVAATAITRLGLWGTFRSVLPGPGLSLRPDAMPAPRHPRVDAEDGD
jgi:magnesium transporter